MEHLIDCRGMVCPEPLIHTRKALRQARKGEQFLILCDNEMALLNVTRYLKELHLEPSHIKDPQGFYKISISVDQQVLASAPDIDLSATCEASQALHSKGVIVLKSASMGSGSDELGKLLMQAYINTLPALDVKPETIICYNAGIFWALKDSPVLESLRTMEALGVRMIVCGTCLDYYQAKEQLAVGQIGNMLQIAECVAQAQPLIYP